MQGVAWHDECAIVRQFTTGIRTKDAARRAVENNLYQMFGCRGWDVEFFGDDHNDAMDDRIYQLISDWPNPEYLIGGRVDYDDRILEVEKPVSPISRAVGMGLTKSRARRLYDSYCAACESYDDDGFLSFVERLQFVY